jgi:spore coat polysaccharide biosynthesis protein SpsF
MSNAREPPLRIIIQSRLSSSRLPAKALLPLGGLPSVLLCARRAARTGIDTLVATSREPSDDVITRRLEAQGLRCFRGALDNVLQRYADASRDLPDAALIVRLTADNVFPDGDFVAILVRAFREQGVEYLATGAPRAQLPYGLSAEVFSAAALRAAAREATTAFQREHVTPWIRAHCRRGEFRSPLPPNWGDLSRLRCTLDSLSDYLRLERVFRDLSPAEAVALPWRQLVERLAALPDTPRQRVPVRYRRGRAISRVTLGTAQLGMPYGIANRQGCPGDEEARAMLCTAIEHGIGQLDTARGYGASEARIGRLVPPGDAQRLAVITKLSSLPELGPEAGPTEIRDAVDASVFRSCRELRQHRLPTLLLHRWAHRHQWRGLAWERLRTLQAQGVIGELGASVASPEEAVEACADPAVKHLQIPFNLLDRRWRGGTFQDALARRPDLTLYARSALLQGLLLLPADRWPAVPGVDAGAITATLDRLVTELGRAGRVDLCLGYVLGQDWVDSVVLGAESRDQILDNVALCNRPPLDPAQCARVESCLPAAPEVLVNPALWPSSSKE